MLLKNVVVKWASVIDPNTRYTPRWEVCIYPDEEGIKVCEKAGIGFKEDNETGELFFRATRNVTTKAGKELSPPELFDAANKPWDRTKLIGNGSVCNVIFDTKEIDAFGKKHTKVYLNKLQVINHVAFGETFGVENPADYAPAVDDSGNSEDVF